MAPGLGYCPSFPLDVRPTSAGLPVPFTALSPEAPAAGAPDGCSASCAVLTKASVLPSQILIYHPAFIKYVFDSWLQGHGRYPSTGILSVIFSLHICDEVRGLPLPPFQERH